MKNDDRGKYFKGAAYTELPQSKISTPKES